MSKKNWNNPEVTTLELHKTLDKPNYPPCIYQGNTSKCPQFRDKAVSLLPVDDPTLYNNCADSHGNLCKSQNPPIPQS